MTDPDDIDSASAKVSEVLRLSAAVDQAASALYDDLMSRAARFDGIDVHEAATVFGDWIRRTSVTAAPATALAYLAIRVSRERRHLDVQRGQ